MFTSAKDFILRNELFDEKTPVLLACSGGKDSMALLHYFLETGQPFAVAHCNFKLRGKESDGDHDFIKKYCVEQGLKFYDVIFDTEKYIKENKISVQEAARELRYDWLEKIRKENGFHVIATAHHADDQAETVLFNLAKGTGIKGLRGMLPKHGKIARPFLSISRKEIEQYIAERNIPFREDSSNASVKYSRNFMRHEVIPLLEKINPDLSQTLTDFTERMKENQCLLEERIQELKKKIWIEKEHWMEIRFGLLRSHPSGKTILFNLLEPYGFNNDQIASIFSALENSISGIQFLSGTHRVIKDRNSLFLTVIHPEKVSHLVFDKIPTQIHFNNFKIEIKSVPVKEVHFKKSERFAYFDADKIVIPILIRYAKEGDYFFPFGMYKKDSVEKAGKKKLSKFFKDIKLSQPEKENTPVVFSGEKVLWIVGIRSDERFKVTDKTKTVLKMSVIDA